MTFYNYSSLLKAFFIQILSQDVLIFLVTRQEYQYKKVLPVRLAFIGLFGAGSARICIARCPL